MTPAGLTTRPAAQGGITVPSIGGKGNFFKNPLGIIGIFLVLTEAIASLVIVNSHLNDLQNTILVLFIVLFPCLVLGVFFLLVTRHHKKLYSPSDYKDEQNFVMTYNSVTQKDARTGRPLAAVASEQEPLTEEALQPIKDALSDMAELQKKVLFTPEPLSEDERNDLMNSMDNFLWELDNESEFHQIEVSLMPKSDQLVELLYQKGYDAALYEPSFEESAAPLSLPAHTAIWLGEKIPVAMAVAVIHIAKEFYPHLKYIELSGTNDNTPSYVKHQIFIGGATSTAKHRKLKPLRPEDFEKLYRITSQQELRLFIRGFSGSA